MSGRAAIDSQPTPRRTPRPAPAGLRRLAAACCAACVTLIALAARAQDEDPGSKSAAAKAADARSPLPPTDPKRDELFKKLQIPDPDRAMFRGKPDLNGNTLPNTGIQDFTPVASEAQNRDEYEAFHEVVGHAGQFAPSFFTCRSISQSRIPPARTPFAPFFPSFHYFHYSPSKKWNTSVA